MADVSGIQAAVEALAGKIVTLRSAVQALREGAVVQTTLDSIAESIEGLSEQIDEIIAEAEGGTSEGGETNGGGEPPTATQLPPSAMPYKSDKQRKFMHAVYPEIAKRWDKETGGKVEPKKKPPPKKGK